MERIRKEWNLKVKLSVPAILTGEVCKERAHLLAAYASATEEYYAAATRELEAYRSILKTPDYEEVRRGVEQARRFAERARRALQRHIASHRCSSTNF